MTVRVQITSRAGPGPAPTCSAETRAKVANHIAKFCTAGGCPGLLFINRVVVVFKVPVIDERHHHPQPVEFAFSHEGVSMPAPKCDLLFVLQVSLQSQILDGTVGRNQVLAALKSWHIPHAQYR